MTKTKIQIITDLINASISLTNEQKDDLINRLEGMSTAQLDGMKELFKSEQDKVDDVVFDKCKNDPDLGKDYSNKMVTAKKHAFIKAENQTNTDDYLNDLLDKMDKS